MKNITKNNKRTTSLIALIILVIGFILIRYSLFKLHGMIQWPFILAILCFVVVIVSFVAKAAITPLSASISYIVGFLLAYIFQTNGTDQGGGRTSNLWLIWTMAIIVMIVVSSIYEIVRSRKTAR